MKIKQVDWAGKTASCLFWFVNISVSIALLVLMVLFAYWIIVLDGG